jgi:ribonuclease VapC
MAVLFQEPDAERFAEAIANAPARRMSVANLVELTMVAAGRGRGLGDRELDVFLARSLIEPVPGDLPQAYAAREAFRCYGKGRHAARLNFGDCFAYALARERGEPLLFKGNDFALTDIASALA